MKRVVLTLVVALLLFQTLVNIKWAQPASKKGYSWFGREKTRVCIAMIDNRFQEQDLKIAAINTIDDLKETARRLSNTTKYSTLSLILNKAYALKYGYQLFLSDTSEYQVFADKTGRVPAWLKPNFILDLQSRHLECEWFAYIDSDAFFYMSAQQMDFDEFFDTIDVPDVNPQFMERIQAKRQKGGVFRWRNQKEFLIIGRNGVDTNPPTGFPGRFLDPGTDYVCTGVFLVKNTNDGRKMMQDWISGPSDMKPSDYEGTYNYFAQRHPWEQRPFNQFIYPKYRQGSIAFSYLDFGHFNGSGIRHIWGVYSSYRIPIMQNAIHELLV